MGGSKANIFIGNYEPKLDGGGRAVQTKILCVDIVSNNTVRIIGTRRLREFVLVLFCLEVPEVFKVTSSLIDRHCPVVFFHTGLCFIFEK